MSDEISKTEILNWLSDRIYDEVDALQSLNQDDWEDRTGREISDSSVRGDVLNIYLNNGQMFKLTIKET